MKQSVSTEGSIVKIDYDDQQHTYGLIVTEPWVRVFDYATSEEVADIAQILRSSILFTVAVQSFAIEEGRWPIIGETTLGPEDKQPPDEFIQDQFDPSNLHIISTKSDGEWSKRLATIDECEGLEPAGVLDPEHVEERIAHYYAGTISLEVLSAQLVRSGQVFTVLIDRSRSQQSPWIVSGRAHATLSVNDKVIVEETGSVLTIDAIRTYMDNGDLPFLTAGQSGCLHLVGDLNLQTRSTSALFGDDGSTALLTEE